jgi:acyl-CoA thioesterase FadM
MSLEQFDVTLPRNAFGPRDTARPGDVWRVFQDAALLGSARRGWPPERYRREGNAFVVRSMVARHARPTHFGEALVARTWVSSFRRGLLSDRQVRLTSGSELVAAATQRWVHVSMPDLKPVRAPAELVAAFELLTPPDGDVTLPSWAPVDGGAEHTLTFRSWFTSMDPLAHANHPAYLDWADEGTSRLLADAGIDPHGLEGVAEEVSWTSGIVAPEEVTVVTRIVGDAGNGAHVLSHRVFGGEGRLCAEATTVRTW